MSSDKHCCVPGCKDSGGMSSVLHGFPNPEIDRVRFNTWLYSIARGSDILSLENAHIYKYRRVCHRHFQEKYQCRNNRISNIAVPTLFLPGLNTILQSHLKLPGVEKKPLQELVQPIPSISTAPQSHLQLMYKTESIKKNTIQKENTGRKISVRMHKLSRYERYLQLKLQAARKRIYKLKNIVKKQAAEIKEAKKNCCQSCSTRST